MRSVSGALTLPVRPAITSDPRNVRPTDEVPRRLDPQGRATWSYKSNTKGSGHASKMGTASPRPHPKGQQQRRSRGRSTWATKLTVSERQNLNVFVGCAGDMGSVSPAVEAPKWPGGTSSRQPAQAAKQQVPTPRRQTRNGSSELGEISMARSQDPALPKNLCARTLEGRVNIGPTWAAWTYGGVHGQGSPGAGKPHAGKYGEWTPSRQRGGSGFGLSLTHFRVRAIDLFNE